MAAPQSHPFTLRWGIMSTGRITEKFVKDLSTDPHIRNVHDVRHRVVAVASSTSRDRAVRFCADVNAIEPVRKYGSYAELLADSEVDIVYVASPISHHFNHVLQALNAGKPVLCEKSLTVTAAQTEKLIEVATAKKLFLMEAVWTRFFPMSLQIRDLVQSGTIGTMYRVLADCSINKNAADGSLDYEDSHRLVNPKLAGGVMLDIGVYALTWIMQILSPLRPESAEEMPTVTSHVVKYHTGTDESASFIVHIPGTPCTGVGSASLRVNSGVDLAFTGGPAIKIQGSRGEIQVIGPAFKPYYYRVITQDGQTQTINAEFPRDPGRDNWGHGLYWEADECARCLMNGKLESDILPLRETLIMMRLIESILRQGDVQYPDDII